MATFNGYNLGTGSTVATSEARRARSIGTTFGADGLECLDGGARGRRSVVLGSTAALAAAMGAALQQIRDLDDGQAHDFTDNFGVTWPNVAVSSFEPYGRAISDGLLMYVRWKLVLDHLS